MVGGSRHSGREDWGPWLTLLIAADDDTGVVAQAVSHTTEDTRGFPGVVGGPGPPTERLQHYHQSSPALAARALRLGLVKGGFLAQARAEAAQRECLGHP